MIQMPLLPYSLKELEPEISWNTMQAHYGSHLYKYVTNLNKLTENTTLDGAPLTELVRNCRGSIFFNAAQVWNHDFFFRGLAPHSTITDEKTLEERVPQQLLTLIEHSFGSLDTLIDKLCERSLDVDGSGWLWVCWKDDTNSLYLETTINAGTPLRHGRFPILCIDLWEHAYYLDYQNRRQDFVKACINLLDWHVINERLNTWKLCVCSA